MGLGYTAEPPIPTPFHCHPTTPTRIQPDQRGFLSLDFAFPLPIFDLWLFPEGDSP